ncbi:hypothetical protein CsSME_00005653 [Camellia sinensis var. sinensis]
MVFNWSCLLILCLPKMALFSPNDGGTETSANAQSGGLGLLIIDKNGFLLGEFSSLDDMRICDAKKENN